MQLLLVLTYRYPRKYKSITFVNIFLIYSHYKPDNPFFMGGYFFLATPCMFYASVNNDVPTFDITKLPTFLPAAEPPPKVEPHEVCKKLLSIKAFKSSGPDNIPSRILREFAYELAEPITRIFNRSITSGVVPTI